MWPLLIPLGWDAHSVFPGCQPCIGLTSLLAQIVKSLPGVQESRVRSLGQKGALEKGIATHSSILAWEIL